MTSESSKKVKVGIMCICLNQPYWQFATEMLWGLDTFFLKHKDLKDKYEVEFLLWSDMPVEYFKGKLFQTEPIEWPGPTLMRYHLFLQQEEYLKQFDYLFYIDVDMRITDWIGEEILPKEGLTAAAHPMYALRRNYIPPYEPNKESSAYIPRPGRLVEENGQKRFQPEYYAGGFQGGKSEEFIKAMKVMRKRIDEDYARNYVAIWNDESHWNRYLFENPPEIMLTPAHIYPDSLLDSYYIKVWGRNYSPKIMTLTKTFTSSPQGGDAVRQLTATM